MSDLKSKWLHWQYVDGKMGHNDFVDDLFDDFNIISCYRQLPDARQTQ